MRPGEPVLCGRRAVILPSSPYHMTSCTLAFGHAGLHDDGHGNRWPERTTSPHLWITPDAMGWGP